MQGTFSFATGELGKNVKIFKHIDSNKRRILILGKGATPG